MIETHELDPLGVAVVLHLGWCDAPDMRTDIAIGRALRRQRSAVARVTARLAALGVIEVHASHWVACETVSLVLGRGHGPRGAKAVRHDG